LSKSVKTTSLPFETAAELASLEPFSDHKFAAEADAITSSYLPVLEPLGLALGPNTEVVLHNFGCLPNTIVAVYGSVSGRGIGGPATNLGLRNLVRSEPERSRVGYETVMPNGVLCRSSSVYLFGSYKQPVGAICINTDLSALRTLRDVVNGLTSGMPPSTEYARSDISSHPQPRERFYTTVDQAAEDILHEAVHAANTLVGLMSKKQKVNVVAELRERGYFLLKGSVELAAEALDVTRYTVYTYLNESKDDVEV